MIYCVEDEKNIRELLIYTLETTGFSARGMANSKELPAQPDPRSPQSSPQASVPSPFWISCFREKMDTAFWNV